MGGVSARSRAALHAGTRASRARTHCCHRPGAHSLSLSTTAVARCRSLEHAPLPCVPASPACAPQSSPPPTCCSCSPALSCTCAWLCSRCSAAPSQACRASCHPCSALLASPQPCSRMQPRAGPTLGALPRTLPPGTPSTRLSIQCCGPSTATAPRATCPAPPVPSTALRVASASHVLTTTACGSTAVWGVPTCAGFCCFSCATCCSAPMACMRACARCTTQWGVPHVVPRHGLRYCHGTQQRSQHCHSLCSLLPWPWLRCWRCSFNTCGCWHGG